METIKPMVNIRDLTDEEFLKQYEKIVYHTVWRNFGKRLPSILSSTGLERDDLMQIGFIGLINARDRFDESRGFKFITYATPLIVGEIQRFLRDMQKVKIPRSIYDVYAKILKEGLLEKSPQEIAEILDVPVETVDSALALNLNVDSLNREVHGTETDMVELIGLLADNETDLDFDRVEEGNVLDSFLNTLSYRDRRIWNLHASGVTQRGIAELYSTTQASISRTLQKIHRLAEIYGKEQGY